MSFADLLSPESQTATLPALPYNPTGFADVVADAFDDATFRQPYGRVAFSEADASIERKKMVRDRFGQDPIDFTGVRKDFPEIAATKFEEVDRRLDRMILEGRRSEPEKWQGIRTMEEIQAASRDAAQVARLKFEETAGKAPTGARLAGSLVGGIGGAFTDPINLATLPFGVGAGTGILRAMAIEGALNMAVEAAEAPFVAQWQRELGFKYGLEEAALDIGTAGIGGAAITGAIRGAVPALRASMRVLDKLSRNKKLPSEARGAAQYMSRVAHIDEEAPGGGTREGLATHREAVQETQEAIRNYREPTYPDVLTGNTDTAAFRDWFGASVATDAEGAPLRLYAGTQANVEAFDPARIGLTDSGFLGEGFYFTPEPGLASLYAGRRGWGGNVMPVYLSIQNPLREFTPGFLAKVESRQAEILTRLEAESRPGPDQGWTVIDARSPEQMEATARSRAITEIAREEGHDSVIMPNPRNPLRGGVSEYIVFRPEQVKSVFNPGTFDTRDARLNDARELGRTDGTDLVTRPVNAAASLAQVAEDTRADALSATQSADFARLLKGQPDMKLLVDGEEKTLQQIADEITEGETIMNAIRTCGIG